MKKHLLCLFAFALLLTALVCVAAAEPVTTRITDIAKYGNLVLDITGADLFDQGYSYGDLLEVTILDQEWVLPLGSNYSDVDSGLPVLRAASAGEAAVLAINMGDFASAAGIAVKSRTEEEPGYRWDYLTQTPVQVQIALTQKDGYRDQWLIHQLSRTDERTDYPHLSDEAFANFRVIDTPGMGKDTLYRSSSPINPEIGRSAYADDAARNAGIVTVVNLADASNTYEGTESAYYQTCQVVYLNLGLDFTADDFRENLAKGLRFIIDGEAPYLLHCNEGKDRAGFASALLECLMGASIDDVVDDYMESYANYYGVEPGSEKYDAVVSSNIIKTLSTAFRTEDVYQADLAAEAEAFLTEDLGLSAGEVSTLRRKLGADTRN